MLPALQQIFYFSSHPKQKFFTWNSKTTIIGHSVKTLNDCIDLISTAFDLVGSISDPGREGIPPEGIAGIAGDVLFESAVFSKKKKEDKVKLDVCL